MTTTVNNVPVLRTFRKALRSRLTPAEAKIWSHLKQAQLGGRKFRRQHSVGFYILDFYCPKERLAVELDGSAHDSVDAQEYDRERDLFLACFGVKVLHFENKWVFQETEAVLLEIKNHFGWYAPANNYSNSSGRCAVNKSTTPPLRGTAPYKGGELKAITTCVHR